MDPDASTLCGLLSDDDRLRVVAALVLGARRPAEVAGATGLDARRTGRALARLVGAGLVETADGGYRLVAGRFADAARAGSARPPGGSDDFGGADADAARVLRNFVRDGRLRSIPASQGKRRAVLDWLSARFEPGRVYPERDVNAVLAQVHPDVAALRRYLVDDEFLERRDGFYWRAGGTFEVD